jgi:hypothetical protein
MAQAGVVGIGPSLRLISDASTFIRVAPGFAILPDGILGRTDSPAVCSPDHANWQLSKYMFQSVSSSTASEPYCVI